MELRAKEPYKLTFDIKAERERALSALPVAFQVRVVPASGLVHALVASIAAAPHRPLTHFASYHHMEQTGENATLTAPVKQLREKGGQHLVVLAAPKARTHVCLPACLSVHTWEVAAGMSHSPPRVVTD